MIHLKIFVLGMILLPLISLAEIITVPGSYQDIQEAIDGSENGDTVLVENGRYRANLDFQGKEITLLGNNEHPEWVILDGRGEGTVITFQNGESNQAVVSGFRIFNGSSEHGGGIAISGASSPTLQHLVFNRNTAEISGGGVSVRDESSVSISHSTFLSNTSSQSGQGVNSDNSEIFLSNITIEGDPNNAAEFGGGIYLHHSEAHLDSVTIFNSTAEWGGGVCTENSNLWIDNVLIYNCQANSAGGGIAQISDEGGRIIANHITISDNRAIELGGGGFYGRETDFFLINSIYYINACQRGPQMFLEGGSVTISYSNVLGGCGDFCNEDCELNLGPGILVDDPEFIDANSFNYHLTDRSSCIDAGDPEYPRDPDGSITDLGAFYFPHFPQIELSVEPIEFDRIEVGDELFADITIRNSGIDELEIENIQIPNENFATDFDGYEIIQPDEELEIRIIFAPIIEGEFSDYVIIESNSLTNNQVEIPVSGSSFIINTVEKEHELTSGKFELSSISPNPFNSSTVIRYNVPSEMIVSLQIFNINGQLVDDFNNQQVSAGKHSVTWNGMGHSAGTYFVKLISGQFSELRKVVLVK